MKVRGIHATGRSAMRKQSPLILIIACTLVAPLALGQSPALEQKPMVDKKPATPAGRQFGQSTGAQPTQPARAQVYSFSLDSFQVMDTRSYHEDTVVAGIGVIVNGTPQKTLTHQLKDFNNGNFNLRERGLNAVQATIGPNDKFVFVFQLYNNGAKHHPNTDELEAYIDRDLLNSQNFGVANGYNFEKNEMGGMQGMTSGWSIVLPKGNGNSSSGEAGYDLIFNVMTGGVFSAIKGVFEGCDGPLAFGLIGGNGAELASHVPAEGPLQMSADFKGTKLKLGAPCNHAGSHYAVNLHVSRTN